MKDRRLTILLPTVLALVTVLVVARPRHPAVNADRAQVQLVEARAHFERILPLIRNFHNDQAGGEMLATVNHLDTLSSVLGYHGMASPAILDSLRSAADSLARRDIGIGLPPEVIAALEALRAELDRAGGAVPGGGKPVSRA